MVHLSHYMLLKDSQSIYQLLIMQWIFFADSIISYFAHQKSEIKNFSQSERY